MIRPNVQVPSTNQQVASPFSLDNDAAYRCWRDEKLEHYPMSSEALMVEVADMNALTAEEHAAVVARCQKANMAIYACRGEVNDAREAVRALGQQLGLVRLDRNLCADEDSVAVLRVITQGRPQEYIPYTDRPINWHTDGYYNTRHEQIRGVVMHCVSDAATGGASSLLDPELIYLLMRDEDPQCVWALMQPEAMTIPPNVEHGRNLRPARTGPVFSIHPDDGSLHMRYTARTRSIQWKDDRVTKKAVDFLTSLLASGLPQIFRARLAPGQGVICNNVVHAREGFSDDDASGKRRTLLRARYYDRIAGTY